MPIIKIAIYATEVACAVLVEVKAGITIRTAREELNVQIAAKRENAEHATEQARFLGQLNGIEFVKVLQNKIGGANNSAGFFNGGSFGNTEVRWLFCTLLKCPGKVVILQSQNQSRKTAMTIEDIRKNPYNPLIADVLYKTSYLESWGSGVKRIVEACRKQNVPDPEWSLRGGFVTVTFRRSTQTNIITDDRKELVLELVPELVQSLSNQVKILITNLKEQEKSASELLLVPEFVQSYSGKSPAYFKKQVIYPAMEQGLVAMLYPDKPKHPKQKYYLTEKGKACLDYLLEIE